jgi:hypothetical protein
MEILRNIPVDLNLGQLLASFHVAPDSDDAHSVEGLVERVRPLARPKALYDVSYLGARGRDTVEIGGVVFTSRVLRVNLEKAHRVFAYVATCGSELEEAAGLATDALHAYWLEEIKALALAAARAYLRDHIEARYKPGRMSQMSPGSLTDWPITQQTQLFTLLGRVEEEIGVRLTDSFLMVPIKSVSGILFPTEVRFESCRLCPRPDCSGRSAPYEPSLWEERYARR